MASHSIECLYTSCQVPNIESHYHKICLPPNKLSLYWIRIMIFFVSHNKRMPELWENKSCFKTIFIIRDNWSRILRTKDWPGASYAGRGGLLRGGGGSGNLLDKGLTRGGYEYSNPNNPTNKHGGMYKRMSGTRDLNWGCGNWEFNWRRFKPNCSPRPVI